MLENFMRLIGIACCLLASAGCNRPAIQTSAPASSATVGNQGAAQNASAIKSADGIELSIVSFDEINERIARHRGKVVVMDAWSTSCPPCLAEFHNLVDLDRKYGREQLACISLSFDFEGLGSPEEQREPVLKFLRSQKATFENLLSSEESDALYRKFKLAAIPAVFVYDRTGKLRKRFDNEHAKSKAEAFTYEQVGELVAQLLAEPAPAEAEQLSRAQ
jgi:thiol-disulfide isomerase/thioredoxin